MVTMGGNKVPTLLSHVEELSVEAALKIMIRSARNLEKNIRKERLRLQTELKNLGEKREE